MHGKVATGLQHLQEMAELSLTINNADSNEIHYHRVLLAINKARLRIEHLKKSGVRDYSLVNE